MLLLPLKEGLSITPYGGGLLFIVYFSQSLQMRWEVRGVSKSILCFYSDSFLK